MIPIHQYGTNMQDIIDVPYMFLSLARRCAIVGEKCMTEPLSQQKAVSNYPNVPTLTPVKQTKKKYPAPVVPLVFLLFC
jgi:hypothetical protein